MVQALSSFEGTTGILGEADLGILPSREKYHKFNSEKGKCGSSCGTCTEVKSKLSECKHIKQDTTNIMNGWCYAELNWSGGSDDEYCSAFYFWLGDIVSKTLSATSSEVGDTNSFSSTMSCAYTAFEKSEMSNNCKILYNNTTTTLTKEEFDRRKKMFDYSKDHEQIRTQIEGAQKYKYHCTKTYYDYVDDILTTYDTMKAICPESGASSSPSYDAAYCTKFKTLFVGYDHSTMEELKTKLVQVTKPASPGSSFMNSSEVNIPAAVSSILGVMGLPALGFFLYKYTSLPSLISNTFFRGGGSNRKRRTTARNEFDTLTSMDTSTLYSTDLSTTETDNSTIYGETSRRSRPPPSQGGRRTGAGRTNNNRRNGNNRNNIRYQRM
ncbi:KIR protein [Plasmodium coatneyi]|uniref:KIR protein n=1 Tax=Plasmodium coatneyi TaxID=208452 RepID=A0A1B1DXK5_9APIC|nr:KIR protein [Plasmodium coatneyi]ANQ07470.1 KIR protein [Plasmodium coatneyi]